MPEIKIRIGAAVDQSMRTVFKPLMQAASEARRFLEKEFAGVGIGMKGSFVAGASAARKEFTGVKKSGEDMSVALERQSDQRTRKAIANSENEWRAYAASAKRAFENTEAAAKASAAKQNQYAINRFAERTSHRATRFFMPNMPIMSMARRAGSEVLQGMGVDTSISGLVQRGVGIESAATALSNRGHIEGTTGPNGQVVASGLLQAEARSVGKQTAVNPEELLKAGQAFVGLTGDLDLWRKIMPQVAKQTAALGGNQEEAARAAGEFAAHVGDVPDKAKAISDLMAVAAGQGKIGGVDFSDFAKYAAKAAAPAAQYQGDKAQNISKLTALAEIAKMHGGASSAAEAFTSIASLTTTLKKPARLKSISGLLGNKDGQFADSEHTILKDPIELIKSLIVAASKGNKDGKSSLDKVAAAVGDSRSLKAVSGLQNTFNEAGGGKAGLAAMDEELKKFSGAVMTAGEVERANNEQLQTTKSKAELFTQALEGVTHPIRDQLVPVLEKLQGPALELAAGLGNLVTWVASNPGEALIAAVSTVILRAGMESAFRAGIEQIIKSAAGGVGGGTGGKGMLAGSGGLIGLFSSAAVIAALAASIYEAGTLAIDKLVGGQAADQRAAAVADGDAGVTESRIAINAKNGTYAAGDEEKASDIEKKLKARIENAEGITQLDKQQGGAPTGVMAALEQAFSPMRSEARADAQHLTALKEEMARVHAMLVQIHSGVLKVVVTNQEQPKAPKAGS